MISHQPKYRPKIEKVTEKLLEVLLENSEERVRKVLLLNAVFGIPENLENIKD